MFNINDDTILKAQNVLLHNQANKYKRKSEIYSSEINEIFEKHKIEVNELANKYNDEISNLKKLINTQNEEIKKLQIRTNELHKQLLTERQMYKKIPKFIIKFFVGENSL